jgi:DNA-binding IclR family transcriptional regulator
LAAPNSSILQLVSGLVAAGYLSENSKVYTLGPGPVLLAHISGTPVVQQVPHSYLTALQEELGLSVQLGVRLGDTFVAVDQVGLVSKTDFLAWDRMRRPLLKTATGKTILSNLPATELHKILKASQEKDPEDVEIFLQELPDIRRSGLAYNLARTVPAIFSVATSAYNREGNFVGAVCVSGTSEIRDKLAEIGELLINRIRGWEIS